MDKLKSVLSGEEARKDDKTVLQVKVDPLLEPEPSRAEPSRRTNDQ